MAALSHVNFTCLWWVGYCIDVKVNKEELQEGRWNSWWPGILADPGTAEEEISKQWKKQQQQSSYFKFTPTVLWFHNIIIIRLFCHQPTRAERKGGGLVNCSFREAKERKMFDLYPLWRWRQSLELMTIRSLFPQKTLLLLLQALSVLNVSPCNEWIPLHCSLFQSAISCRRLAASEEGEAVSCRCTHAVCL